MRERDNRRSAVDGVQVQSRPRLQRADAKRGDAIADLVKRNQAARHRSGDGRQFFLAKTDGQRQQRRTTQARPAQKSKCRGTDWFSAHTRWQRRRRSTTNGKTRQTSGSGNHFSMAANRMRPAVTMPQKMARASDAMDALAPKCFVM